MKIALIDADSLTYSSSKDTLEESIQIIDEKILNILEKTEAEYFSLFISKGKYFRHNIDKNYKSKRGKSELKWLKTLKSYLEEKYQANWMEGVEADDLIAYWMDNPLFFNKGGIDYYNLEIQYNECITINPINNESETLTPILCAIDKDLLKSIPGKHFNYSYKLADKNNPNSIIKGEWISTSYDDALTFRWLQLLMGDSSDGVEGLKGVGIKTAEKVLYDSPKYEEPETILSKYISYYRDITKAIFEFQKNYRLLHMLDSNEDFMREVGQIPLLPKILKSEDFKTNTTTQIIFE